MVDAAVQRSAGWSLLPAPLSNPVLDQLDQLSERYARRGLVADPRVQAAAEALHAIATAVLGADAALVGAIWFDKQPTANWRVPWHQDRHACLRPFTASGWGPWSAKHGLPHVLWPSPWTESRLAMRIHLDACTSGNGPLHVATGSHQRGVLDQPGIDAMLAQRPTATIVAARGDVLLMHPLLLHRSDPAAQPRRRRVLHLEWCGVPPPQGGSWRTWWP